MKHKSKKYHRKISRHSRRKMIGGVDLEKYRAKLLKKQEEEKTQSQFYQNQSISSYIPGIPGIQGTNSYNMNASTTINGKIYLLLSTLISISENMLLKSLNIDPKNPLNSPLLNNSSKIIFALNNSPQGIKLKSDMKKILSETVDILDPALNKLKVILNNFINDESDLISKILVKLILSIPGLGDILGIGGAIMNSAQAATKAVESISEATDVGAGTIKDLKNYTSEISNLLNNAVGLIGDKTSGSVNTALDVAQNKLNIYNKQISMQPPTNPLANIPYNIGKKQYGGGHYTNREYAEMVGGRINLALREFMG